MKKTALSFGLLTLLAAGLMSGAAFADPPFLNAHVWQNNPGGWNNNYRNYWGYDRDGDHDRFRDGRQEAREHWQFERQRLAERRHFLNDRYHDRMEHYRMAQARFNRNHFWDRDHDGDRY